MKLFFRIKNYSEHLITGVFSVLSAAIIGFIERDKRHQEMTNEQMVKRLESLELRVAMLEGADEDKSED